MIDAGKLRRQAVVIFRSIIVRLGAWGNQPSDTLGNGVTDTRLIPIVAGGWFTYWACESKLSDRVQQRTKEGERTLGGMGTNGRHLRE